MRLKRLANNIYFFATDTVFDIIYRFIINIIHMVMNEKNGFYWKKITTGKNIDTTPYKKCKQCFSRIFFFCCSNTALFERSILKMTKTKWPKYYINMTFLSIFCCQQQQQNLCGVRKTLRCVIKNLTF
jgi:hypothetical protein